MIRGQRHMAIAVRRPDGDILVHAEPLEGAIYVSRLVKLPFVRGFGLLWDTLVLGIRSLLFSANVSLEQEEAEISSGMVTGILAAALLVAVVLFFVAPLLVMGWLDQFISSSIVSNIAEGVIRLGVFLAYLLAVSFMPDVKRLFAYHGAEHKSVNAFEAGEVTDDGVGNVQKYSTAHPRCGTGFLLVVMVVSIVAFALLGRPPMWLRVLSRILLVPVIASISYEFLRLGAKHFRNRVVRLIFAPGLALQRLTTRQPDDKQVEVAVAALRRALQEDGLLAREAEPASLASTTAGLAPA